MERVLRGLFCLFFMAAFACVAEDGANPGAPLTISKNKAVLDLPEIKWNTNRFLKNEPSAEKTPDRESSIKISVNAESAPRIIFINAKQDNFKNFSLIDGDWENISFWIKPDDSDMLLTPTFKSLDKENPFHTGRVRLLGKKWKKVVIPKLWSKKNRRLKLKDVEYFSFQLLPMGQKKGEFLIGPLSIERKTEAAKLEPLKSKIVFKTSASPKLDGALDDDCWKNLKPIKDFIWRNEKSEKVPSEVKICFDEKNIYFGAKQTLDTSRLLQEHSTRDMNVWMDDCFEIFLNLENDETTQRQFIVNSLNVKQDLGVWFDQVKDDFALHRQWNGKWKSAVKMEKDFWSVEVAIPFSDLGKNASGKRLMGLQLAFENHSVKNIASWNPTTRFTNARNFGVAFFAEKKASRLKIDGVEISFQDPARPALVLQMPSVKTGTVIAYLGTRSGKVFSGKSELKEGRAKILFPGYSPENGMQRLSVWGKGENGGDGVCGYKVGPMQFGKAIPFGEVALCPRPKEMKTGKGAFKADGSYKIFSSPDAAETAERVKNDLSGYMQIELKVEIAKNLPSNAICIAEKLPSGKIKSELSSKPEKEAYILNVSSGKVFIEGSSPAGLFYGAITLSQLERYAYIRNESSLAERRIKDWPSLPNRIWENWAQGLTLRRTKATKKEILDAYEDVLDRYAIGAKFNRFGLNFADSVTYERPKNKKVNLYPNAEFLTMPLLKKLSAHCRKNFMEFIPCIHGPSHALWMTIPYPELAMPGYSNWDADPTHPKFFDVYFSACDEIADAVKPKYFHPWLDEWWHQPKGKLSTSYKGKEKRDIYLETVKKLYDYHKKAGRRMLMFSCMLQREHNGGKPYDNYLNMDKLPRDIIMCHWSGGRNALKKFAELGYENWCLENRFKPIGADQLPKSDKICGFGTINYEFLNPDFGYGYGPMLRGGDYAWNFGDGFELPLEDWMMEYGRNVMSMYSVMPNPKASHEFIPLDIAPQCNDSFFDSKTGVSIEDLPQGRSEIGFIPTMISSGKEKNCILGAKKASSIPVDAKAASVIFLHTQVCPKEKRKEFFNRSRMKESASGIVTGVYEIVYEDGSSLSVPISNGRNCGNWLPYKGRCTTEVENKYINDARYVWEGGNANGKRPCLYQYEWVNPRADLPIKEIRFSSTGKEAAPLLFAVTLRKPLK